MQIAGITQCTLLDFPDTPSCILFFAGCNLRCGYCHNPEMVLPGLMSSHTLPWESVMNFLKRRQGLLEGVVLCGGEPTLVPEIMQICSTIKSMGYRIKLDTNGTRPVVLHNLIQQGLIDYVAMDFKCPNDQLEEVCVGARYGQEIQASLDMLRSAEIPYEIRTTVIKEIHSTSVLMEMAKILAGVPTWNLQDFRSGVTLRENYSKLHGYGVGELGSMSSLLAGITGGMVGVR